ncbi:MAG: cellulase family glycosylhydrolase, partial [Clostridia bacterium]
MSRMLPRLTFLFLCLILLTYAVPSSALATAEALNQATADDELSQAFASGLAPERWTDQLDTPMAINDFCTLMMRVIDSINASAIPVWEDLAKNALASTREMKREDAMIAVYQAACLLGHGRDTTGDWGATDHLLESGNHFWELSWEYPEWTNLEEDAPFCTDCDKLPGGAYHFAQGQVSLVSGKRVFDLDEENKDLHMLEPLSKGEALLILQRLGESLQPQAEYRADAQEQTDPCPDFVALSDAATCTLHSDTLAATAAMPSLAIQRDRWRGTSLALDTVSWRTNHRLYRQEDCQAIADMGFNYVRLQVDCVQLLSEEGLIDRTILENIDHVIDWCAQVGVHVNLDLHSVPGYGVGLSQEQKDILTNSAHAALAEELWRTLAKRYRDISAGALSFNLVNEPTAFDFTQEE